MEKFRTEINLDVVSSIIFEALIECSNESFVAYAHLLAACEILAKEIGIKNVRDIKLEKQTH